MTNPVKEIIRYLHKHETADELKRAFVQDQEKLDKYTKLQKCLPRLIRELETTVGKLRELID